ncbi:MAG TPA: homocysteine S-methyltransferase family protein [Candidatus Ornithomonoglobus merdipullorum]|uniref:Methionine synthase n=1 Tax=Candidatus Ornithomonoglobus merdipullorum TaxID=2840895 RepID=A0A9D1MC33_9FIRM|nr:homocysteine S-methyltransferase family protein [Candidatus Ornithomonoglobus merdipullorum]
MDIREILGRRILFFDGGMGTMLQKYGMKAGELPELLNITDPQLVCRIHDEYLAAGADIITTNTFGANPLKSDEMGASVDMIIAAAVGNARKSVNKAGGKERFVAFDIGPTGKLMEPIGDLSFDRAYEEFARIAKTAETAGADLAIIETMSDTLEAKAAVLAVKENTKLPVFLTMTFDETYKTLTGADVHVMSAMFEGLGVDCLGINCGLGPVQIAEMMEELSKISSIPIMAQPNAGLPQIVDGKTVYDVDPEQFGEECERIAKCGASVIGGCCGTTPDHIKALIERCGSYSPIVEEKNFTAAASYSKAVYLDDRPVIIGERINPTGKKKFKEALREGDVDYIVNEAFKQRDAGAHILDVNVGLPEIDECSMMERAVKAVSAAVNLPLQIDSSDPEVIERALRIYNGKPMVNSVNGKKESLDAILPIVAKYGGVLVGLCLDENGIPETAEERAAIAKRIADEAAKYGIKKRDLVMDALTLTISAQQKESAETAKALHMIKTELGIKTVLGVSNISFGLPRREIVNSTFFALALYNGLDACIINPCADSMMNTYRAYRALACIDTDCADYIAAYAGTKSETTVTRADAAAKPEEEKREKLFDIIVKGLRDQSYEETKALLKTREPMDIINGILIPALDAVGKEFEAGTMFLPQLMMSAETVKNSFDAVKEKIMEGGVPQESKGKIVVATVKGDIHDIGKNIVKVLLENYGYDVYDLGKDVPPEDIVNCMKENDIHLCGLSALMTTTVVSMEETIKAIRAAGLDAKVWVGGAVLTQEYADMIGADKYCKDALSSVNYANEFFGN